MCLIHIQSNVRFSHASSLSFLTLTEYKQEGLFNAKAMFDTTQRVASVLETNMGPAMTIGLNMDVKHTENKYMVGVSLGLGGQ